MNLIEKEVRSLKGGVIVEAKVLGGCPTLAIRMPNGRIVQVEAWRDPEGNGPGFLSIDDPVADETPGNPQRGESSRRRS